MAEHLIVGLGNPGKEYEDTRHNIGFLVLDELCRQWGLTWKEDKRFYGFIAKGNVDDETVVLLKPTTYMNESGRSVRRVLDFYKWKPETLLVIVDDIALPFGDLRFKTKGSSGGHNGLKSVQAHTGTQQYYRLRMGIGDRRSGTLTGHVLGKFSQREREALDSFLQKGTKLTESFVRGEDAETLMASVNQRLKPPQRPGGANSQAPATRGNAVPGTNGPRGDKTDSKESTNPVNRRENT